MLESLGDTPRAALLLCQIEAMAPAAESRYVKNVFEAVAKERGTLCEKVVALWPVAPLRMEDFGRSARGDGGGA